MRVGHWLVPVMIALISILIAFGDETARQWFRYDRLAIQGGEVWRLVTGHFAHLGVQHLGLNLAALFLVWALVGRRLSMAIWITIVVLTLAGIDIGFWFLDVHLIWYVGLSGLLHGLLIAGAFAGLTQNRSESVIILLLAGAKVAYEQFAGPLPGSELGSGGPVVVNAHLYGALSGLAAGLVLWHRARRGNAI